MVGLAREMCWEGVRGSFQAGDLGLGRGGHGLSGVLSKSVVLECDYLEMGP